MVTCKKSRTWNPREHKSYHDFGAPAGTERTVGRLESGTSPRLLEVEPFSVHFSARHGSQSQKSLPAPKSSSSPQHIILSAPLRALNSPPRATAKVHTVRFRHHHSFPSIHPKGQTTRKTHHELFSASKFLSLRLLLRASELFFSLRRCFRSLSEA